MIYEYRCKDCKLDYVLEDVPMGHRGHCPSCGTESERVYLTPISIKVRKMTPVQRGIRKDLLEISSLEDQLDSTRDKDTRYELSKEIRKINDTPVTGGKA